MSGLTDNDIQTQYLLSDALTVWRMIILLCHLSYTLYFSLRFLLFIRIILIQFHYVLVSVGYLLAAKSRVKVLFVL